MAALQDELRPRIRALCERLDRDEKAGRDRSAVRQALTEFRWRLEYNGNEPEARSSWAGVELLAAAGDVPGVQLQDGDGSHGRYSTAWFLKLDASTDLFLEDTVPVIAPRFLDQVNDPGRLEAYLWSLVVSRPEIDGVDRRKELNFVTADLLRLILRERPLGYRWHPRLARVIQRFIVDWQDPATGFFGPEYEIGDAHFRCPDLSMTFHVARYLDGAIGHWPELIDTLLAIRDDPYPNGWLAGDRLTAHHAYDVATLFSIGWPHLGNEARQRAGNEIAAMIDTLAGTAGDDPLAGTRTPNETVAESCYFLAAFLDVTGYFAPDRRFWTNRCFAAAPDLKRRLIEMVRSLDQREKMARMALERLGNQ